MNIFTKAQTERKEFLIRPDQCSRWQILGNQIPGVHPCWGQAFPTSKSCCIQCQVVGQKVEPPSPRWQEMLPELVGRIVSSSKLLLNWNGCCVYWKCYLYRRGLLCKYVISCLSMFVLVKSGHIVCQGVMQWNIFIQLNVWPKHIIV